ncbi:hypothetical protein PtA15_4A717 [Puccinia triticina]|uniref:Uncharacterized protein n=1 Tax=Puccinia triticina TaxID=208348 RepID=A0ABY7CHW3_9BASI|nr:uncharacterized protein PtA15_4A717 [Puccinia triticina]WAQ84264.1 hypothetical protein PtA15_4A717 [Puccinia triticina]
MARSSRASASPRPPSSARPPRPPSRQSKRVITPVKTHGNYVRPNDQDWTDPIIAGSYDYPKW